MTKTQEIYRLLGADAANGRVPVLIPIEARKKWPAVGDWLVKTSADMEDPAWLAQIEVYENTGVLLGSISGGLVTIDIETNEFIDGFLELNPRLRGSLRTHGNQGCQVWMWMTGVDYPQRYHSIRHGNRLVYGWRGGDCQSVVRGIHPSGNAYTVVVDAPPVEIGFGDIVWPVWAELPWND